MMSMASGQICQEGVREVNGEQRSSARQAKCRVMRPTGEGSSNVGENARINDLRGAKVILAPHQTGGDDSRDPHTTDIVDGDLGDTRHADPRAIEAALSGPRRTGMAHTLAVRPRPRSLPPHPRQHVEARGRHGRRRPRCLDRHGSVPHDLT